MSFTELEQQIIDYNLYVDNLELYSGENILDRELLKSYVKSVKCFQQYDEIGEFSVGQILNRFVGKWETRDAYIEEELIEFGIESSLQDILIPCPICGVSMFLECLNYDKVWGTMSQMGGALKGYKWNNPNNEEADHYFYVYDMTR
jgi:hypothetical protein